MVPNRTGLKLFLPSVLTVGAIALSSVSAWAGTPSAGSWDGSATSADSAVSFNPLPSREAGFAPRGSRTLSNTVSGGRRGSCGSSAVAIKPLVPGEQGALTASAHPSLWVYVPAGAGETARFRLTDAQDADLDEQTIALPQDGGLVKISLRDRGQALAVGQSYQWYLSVDCDRVAGEAPRNTFASGWIQRVNPSAAPTTTASNPLAAATAYARAGIWYDAVNNVIEADRSNARSVAWKTLAASAGLDQYLVAVNLPDAQ